MHGNSRARAISAGVAATVSAFTLLVALPSSAHAAGEGCKDKNGDAKLCGEVSNASHLAMHTTIKLGSGSDRCDVWNYDGGDKQKWVYAECTQKKLSSGGRRGGSGVDVDAVTFNSEAYILDFHGATTWKAKGVWTKIRDNETATCGTDVGLGVPFCRITWDLG
ncbi:hypothetical protein AB0N81_22205 [Streptomyces sp. NPDC093510]|uniref:hypothetical protein n=1 Tax=Streptomyces sp. NPDC093510 TaxID=3155199 RepID=UPI00343DD9CC